MATYHGMTFMQCSGCGYRTEDDYTMEIWNDLLMKCPECEECGDGIWGTTDGNTYRKDGERRYSITNEFDPSQAKGLTHPR